MKANEIKEGVKVAVFKAPEGDYRKICLDKMFEMSQVVWTPKEDIVEGWEKQGDFAVALTYKKGIEYHGIAYTGTRASLENFTQYVNKKGQYDFPNHYYEHLVGNHCSSSMGCCYELLIPMGHIGGVKPCVPWYPEMLKFPTDLYVPIKEFGTSYDSVDVFNMNSKKAVFDAYAAAKPADLLYFSKKTGSGHVRMVSKEAKVVYNDDGTINGAKSYITTIEQTNCFESTKHPEFIDVNGYDTTWWVNHVYTFDELYKTLFMPVTLSIFSNGEKAKDAYLFLEDGNTEANLKKSLKGKLTCTFPMNFVRATVKNKQGKIVADGYKYNQDSFYNMELSEFNETMKLSELPSGNYTYELVVGLGRGTANMETIKFSK